MKNKKEQKDHENTKKAEKNSETVEKDQKIGELTETLQRLQAEFENYKKRTDSEKEQTRQLASKSMIIDLISIIDNFNLALQNTDSHEEFVKGVKLIYSQIFEMIEQKGVKPIECIGEKFDPYKHEALLTEESDKESGTILEEIQKGYEMDGSVLRHSKVKVAK